MAVYGKRQGDNYFIQGFRYIVEIPTLVFNGGTGVGVSFRNISGLSKETEVVEYREGADPLTVRKFPGLTTYGDVTFEKGATYSAAGNALAHWHKLVMDVGRSNLPVGGYRGQNIISDQPLSRSIYHDVYIYLYERERDTGSPNAAEAAKTYVLHDAWPISVSIGDLDASSSDVLIETIVLAHSGFEIVDNGDRETA